MQPAHRLELGEVKDGLGGDRRSEAVRNIDLPEIARPQSLALNQVSKALITELLLRKRLWPKGNAKVG